MTRKVLSKLPEHILSTIRMWKSRYNDERFKKDITRAEIRGYVKGLVDAGTITANEYRVVFAYMTI